MNPAVYVAVLCLVLGAQATDELTDNFDLDKGFVGYTSANVNEFADRLIAEISPLMMEMGMDPFKAPFLNGTFNVTFLFTYEGYIELDQGYVNGLSTIRRSGDSYISYDHRLLRHTMVVKVEELLANFLYVATLMDIGPSGLATVTIQEQELLINLVFNLEEMTVSLEDFIIEKENSYIDIHLSESGLTDILLNLLVDAIVGLFRDNLLYTIEDQIQTQVSNFLSAMPPLLPPLPVDPDHPLTCLQETGKLLLRN